MNIEYQDRPERRIRARIASEESKLEFDSAQIEKEYEVAQSILGDRKEELASYQEHLDRVLKYKSILSNLSDSQLPVYNLQTNNFEDCPNLEELSAEREDYSFEITAETRGFSLDSLVNDPAFQKMEEIRDKIRSLWGKNDEVNKGQYTGGIPCFGGGSSSIITGRSVNYENPMGKEVEKLLFIADYGGIPGTPISRKEKTVTERFYPLQRALFFRQMNEETYNQILDGTHPEVKYALDIISQTNALLEKSAQVAREYELQRVPHERKSRVFLSEEQKIQIAKLRGEGESVSDLAKKFNVSTVTANNAVRKYKEKDKK